MMFSLSISVNVDDDDDPCVMRACVFACVCVNLWRIDDFCVTVCVCGVIVGGIALW